MIFFFLILSRVCDKVIEMVFTPFSVLLFFLFPFWKNSRRNFRPDLVFGFSVVFFSPPPTSAQLISVLSDFLSAF